MRPRRRAMGCEIHIVQTTLPSAWNEAEVGAFAQGLLQAGAACIHHDSIRSTYRWEGAIESSLEWRLQVKVGEDGLGAVLAAIEKSHPYDVPEIIHWSANASQSYGEWVNSA
jgi:periplasmic divalent cation tolerance protein